MRKILLVAMCLVIVSCNETNEIVDANQSRVSLAVQNLPPLDGGHYQLWATFFRFNKPDSGDSPTHEGEFVSIGEFKVMDDGSLRSLNGSSARFSLPSGRNPQLLKDVVLAVQTDLDHGFAKTNDEEPGSILIGGAFHGDASRAIADLSISYADAFRTSFSSVSGKCTITCPTSPADSNSGVWFIEPGSPITAGLKNLPALPQEWRYEGWVMRPDIVNGGFTYWSTGKFAKADSADYDGAGPNSGTGSAYNFPGQDFVRGSTVFSNLLTGGYSFMITMEPFPDVSANPFFLKLLSTQSVAVPPTGRSLTMQNVVASSAPTAHVIIER